MNYHDLDANNSAAVKPAKPYRWACLMGKDGAAYHNVGIEADGSLYNPNGYPDEDVWPALLRVRQTEAMLERRQAEWEQKRDQRRAEHRAQLAAERLRWESLAPEERVEESRAAAERRTERLAAQEAKRRREAIERGVAKRRERREQRIHEAARQILESHGIGNRESCYCCHKVLSDPGSVVRGIGPECWDHVLNRVAWLKGAGS
jgi:hypothetical protein